MSDTDQHFHYGDIIWVDFDPSAGHEQQKRRPALVVSNDDYNRYNNLIMVVPITAARHYPLHIPVGEIATENNTIFHGWAEIEQLKSIDVEARHAEIVGSAEGKVCRSITNMILGCLLTPLMSVQEIIPTTKNASTNQ